MRLFGEMRKSNREFWIFYVEGVERVEFIVGWRKRW